MMSTGKRLSAYLMIVAAGLFADQFSKYLAVTRLKEKSDLPLIQGVLSLTYVENTGAAFGMLRGGRYLFSFFAAAVIIFSLVTIIRMSGGTFFMVFCLALISAGAAGNLIDRVFGGSVIDFIWFSLIDFPVFNAADIFVVTGCFLMIFSLLTGSETREEKT